MKRRLFLSALIAACMSSGGSSVARLNAGGARSVLPTEANAKTLLNATTRHREWVTVTVGTGSVATLAFVVYPERPDRAPVVLVTARGASAKVRSRAIGDQLAAEGFISITPEATSAVAYDAARAYATRLPAADGKSAWLDVDFTQSHAQVATESSGVGHFSLSTDQWPQVIEYLSHATGNRFAAAAQQAGRSKASRMIPGLADKVPGLPSPYYAATKTLAESKLKREYVDIPVGDLKLHAWVEYPAGTGKTGVVIVMQHGVGLDDWMRSVADQIAADGFIAVAPDAWSGTGPNGGNRDSFQFDDDAMRAAARITPDETQRRYKAARDWALMLPRANGRTGSIGFCAGGGNSFRFAGEVPELNASVVFYGTPPSEELVKKINAPVLAFYGENDARVTATAEPTTALMKRLGKSFEPHVYPKVTHSFVYFQDLSVNREAVADAWPRVVAFYNKYLR
jgi:carboxymethylenebutenolidase